MAANCPKKAALPTVRDPMFSRDAHRGQQEVGRERGRNGSGGYLDAHRMRHAAHQSRKDNLPQSQPTHRNRNCARSPGEACGCACATEGPETQPWPLLAGWRGRPGQMPSPKWQTQVATARSGLPDKLLELGGVSLGSNKAAGGPGEKVTNRHLSKDVAKLNAVADPRECLLKLADRLTESTQTIKTELSQTNAAVDELQHDPDIIHSTCAPARPQGEGGGRGPHCGHRGVYPHATLNNHGAGGRPVLGKR